MACNPLNPISCVASGAGQAIGGAATSALGNSFADAMRNGTEWMVKTTIGWWIQVPSIDLATSPVDSIRGYVQWIAVMVAVVGVSWQGIMLMLSRRPEPLINVGRGFFYIALWSSIGIVGPAAALRAGDSFSTWVLDEAAGGQASTRLVKLASLEAIPSTGAVIILGLLMMLAGLVQAVLMLFREAAIVILAGVIVLAAAGSFNASTRPWLPKVLGWMLALITYKPAAALVYASALTLTGDSNDPRTVVVGLTMMLLAIVALPVLMKFFTWTTGAATGAAEVAWPRWRRGRLQRSMLGQPSHQGRAETRARKPQGFAATWAPPPGLRGRAWLPLSPHRPSQPRQAQELALQVEGQRPPAVLLGL